MIGVCLFVFACVVAGYFKSFSSKTWQQAYRVGKKPRWLPKNYPDGRFVDWTDLGPSEWRAKIERDVHLVASVMELKNYITVLYGLPLESALEKQPTDVVAATLVFYFHTLIGAPITASQAFKMVYLLHYQEGFEGNPSGVAASSALEHSPLFEMRPSLALSQFLSAVPRLFEIDVVSSSTVLHDSPPPQGTSPFEARCKSE